MLIGMSGSSCLWALTRVDVQMQEGQWLGTSLDYWVAPSAPVGHNLTYNEVLERSDWQQATDAVPSFGIVNDVYWLRLPLSLPEGNLEPWIIEVAYAVLEEVDFFVLEHGQLIAELRSHDARAALSRHRHFVMTLPHTSGNLDVLMRVKSSASLQLPVAVWRESTFIEKEESTLLLVGGAFGVMLAMMAYNLFVAVSGGNRVYYKYTAMVIAVMFLQGSLLGMGERFLWGGSTFWRETVLALAVLFSVYFGNWFCDDFLQLDATTDPWRHGYRLIRWLALLLAGLFFFMPLNIVVIGAALLAVIGSCYTVLLIVRHYDSDDRAVQFFCLAWFVLLVGVLLLAFNKLGVIPRNFYTENLMLIGTVIELVMLSLALGERINHERTQKEIAQARAIALERKERESHTIAMRHEALTRKAQEISLNLQKDNNVLLERKVEERSRALEDINHRLEELTLLDPLTGVRNRRFLNERLQEEYSRACREGVALSVLMVDVDRFKQINDQFGHLVGDDCLKAMADILERVVSGPGAMVTRFGGEEFCIVLPYANESIAGEQAESLRKAVAVQRMTLRGRTLRVTVSVGTSTCIPSRDGKPEDLLDAADQALYEAKNAGRNCVRPVLREFGT